MITSAPKEISPEVILRLGVIVVFRGNECQMIFGEGSKVGGLVGLTVYQFVS